MTDLPRSAAGIAAAVRQGDVSPTEVVKATLDRIAAWEPYLRAWVHLDEDGALEAARTLEVRLARGEDPGPLTGVPMGLKDIFDVAGLPTRNGVPVEPPVARRDSTAARKLREAGAVILGKTVTTAFAFHDPSIARNPRHPGRTPGGSSAGSGAAVGAGTIPAALGSQTAGSTLRPGAYNGAVGFKPTFGRIGRSGVTPLAPSLDHVGIICHAVLDAVILFDALAGFDPGDPSSRPGRAASAVDALRVGLPSAPRLGVLVDAVEWCSDGTKAEFARVRALLEQHGAQIVEVRLPLTEIVAAQRITMWSEAAAIHHDLTVPHPHLPVPKLRAVLQAGALIPANVYLRADRLRRKYRALAVEALSGLDAIIHPTVVAVAPTPETTGDASLQAPWSLLGMPSISVPTGLDPDGLPFGFQLVGPSDGDADLLRVARWVELLVPPLPIPTVPER